MFAFTALLLHLLLLPTFAIDIVNLRTEYLANPLGLDVVAPRFSYEITSNAALQGLAQKSYRLSVHEVGATGSEPIWTSLDVHSSNTHNIKFGVGGSTPTSPLKSGTLYRWTATVTSTGGVTQVSPVATFSMGMLGPTAWTGQLIGMGSSSDGTAAPWFRRTFELPAGSLAATSAAFLYVASVGFCQVTVNGQAVSEGVLLPSISYLPGRVLYRTYNVSAFLNEGANNTVGLWASSGWGQYESFQWAMPLQYKQTPLVMAELQIAQHVVVATDATWEVRSSTTSHLGGWGKDSDGNEGFGGDLVDTTLAVAGWDTPDVALASPWLETATLYPLASNITVSADVMEPTRKHSSVAPSTIAVQGSTSSDSSDSSVVGCGNVTITMESLYTGWFEITELHAPPQSTLRFYVSTTSGVDVEFDMMDGLKINASGVGHFQMRFSYHAIHYITIVGLTVPPRLSDITGWRLSVALERKGMYFSTCVFQ